MSNVYLDKIAALIRSPANLGTRMSQLSQAAANKIHRITGQSTTPNGLAVGGIPIRTPETEKVLNRVSNRLDKLSTQPHFQNPQTEQHFHRVQGTRPGVIK